MASSVKEEMAGKNTRTIPADKNYLTKINKITHNMEEKKQDRTSDEYLINSK